jgi:hypothetical protein
MLRLADDLRSQGREAAADAVLRALFDNPDRDVRLEARFRFARAMSSRRRYAEAIEQLDHILVERPSAAPVRFELAKALELSGDHARSLREFSRLRAGALPANLAREIDQVVSTLRSRRAFGGSVELGMAPDSNVNGATGATTVLVNGLPFLLDPDARRRSGLGIEAAAQVYWRQRVSGNTQLVAEALGRGTVYRDAGLDDGVVQVGLGPEFGNRLRTSVFGSRRWYLGNGYSWSYGGTAQWLKPVSRRATLDLGGRIERIAVPRSNALNATAYTATIALERALRPTLFARASVAANRYQARSPVYSTTSIEAAVLLAKDFGPLSIYGRVGYAHLRADGLFLGAKREDNRFDLGGGVSLRRLRIWDASPIIRVTRVVNGSSAVLYDTSRTRLEVALSRPF